MKSDIRAVLFDLDGVIIVDRPYMFSIRLSKEHNVPMEHINEFFEKDFRDCSWGKADLKERIKPYLEKWNWKGTVDELLQYWFESEGTVSQEGLKIISDLRKKGVKCYIATRNEKYRRDYLWNNLKLKDYFDGIFCSCDIGHDKCSPDFFDHVVDKLKLEPKEIMFLDDREKNVECAKRYGIDAHLCDNIETLKKELEI